MSELKRLSLWVRSYACLSIHIHTHTHTYVQTDNYCNLPPRVNHSVTLMPKVDHLSCGHCHGEVLKQNDPYQTGT